MTKQYLFSWWSRKRSGTLILLVSGLLLSSVATAGTFNVPSLDTDGTYTVSWSGYSGDPLGYSTVTVKVVEGTGTSPVISSANSGSITRTKPNGSYPYTINVCTKYRGNNTSTCNSTAGSETKYVTVAITPPSPSSISFNTTALECDTPFDVQWSSVSGANRYVLQERKKIIGSTTWSTWSTLNSSLSSTVYSRSTVSAGHDYQYQVNAYYSQNGQNSGSSAWRTSSVITKPSCTAPAVPTISGSAATGEYAVSFAGLSGANSLYRIINGGTPSVISTSTGTGQKTVGQAVGDGAYDYYVRGCTSQGTCLNSTTRRMTVNMSPPAVPSVLDSPVSKSGAVAITFNGLTGTNRLYERVNGNDVQVATSTGTTGTSVNRSLGNGIYDYYVRGCNTGGACKDSSLVRTTVVKIPGTPGGLSFSPSSLECDSAFNVNWGAASGGNRYEIAERARALGGSWPGWGASLATSLTGLSFTRGASLTNNREYQYQVRASYTLNGYTSDPGPWSAASVVKPDCIAPSAPQISETPSYDGTFNVTFSGFGGTNTLYYRINGGTTPQLATTQTGTASKTMGMALADGIYDFYVRACTQAGTCLESSLARTTVVKKPATPGGLAIVGSTSSCWNDARLDWNDVSGSNITYFVEARMAQAQNPSWFGSPQLYATVTTSHLDLVGLDDQLIYEFKVSARQTINGQNSGTTSYSTPLTLTNLPDCPTGVAPSPTSNETVSLGGSFTISFTGSETSQLFERVNGGGWTSVKSAGASGSYTPASAKGSGTYDYFVKSCFSSGITTEGGCRDSTPVSVTVVRTPGAPGTINFSDTNLECDSDISLSWSSASGANSYQVNERSKATTSSTWSTWATKVTDQPGLSYSSGAVSNNRDYQYQVLARYKLNGQWSQFSAVSTSAVIRKPACSPPSPPTVSKPADPSAPYSVSFSGFKGVNTLYEKRSGGQWQSIATQAGSSQKSISRDPASGVYEYYVRACTLKSTCADSTVAKTLALESDVAGTVETPPQAQQASLSMVTELEKQETDDTQVFSGEFSVSPGGAATYHIPIKMAVGTGGTAPSVSLDYSSQSGNGLVGMGWQLSAGGGISRCRQTLVADKIALPVAWNAEDRFCLNGQRLLLVDDSTTYGAVGAVYKTEIDSYVKVTSVGGALGYPDYFRVEAKNGSTYWYGDEGADDSELRAISVPGDINVYDPPLASRVLTWKLRRSDDRAGNSISYIYETPSLVHHHLTEIRYAYGAADPDVSPLSYGASVVFDYEDRKDGFLRYVSGHQFNESQRLRSITTYASYGTSQIFRKYRLDYEGGDSHNTVSRLGTIEECVSDTNCLEPLVFEWGDIVTRSMASSTDAITLGSWAKYNRNGQISSVRVPNYTQAFADINGDGRQDLVWFREGSGSDGGLHYSLQNAAGAFEEASFKGSAPSRRVSDIEDYPVSITPLDINADGYTDIALFVAENESNHQGSWTLFLSSPNSDGSWQLLEISTSVFSFPAGHSAVAFVDMNTDGLVDMVTGANDGKGYNGGVQAVRYLERDLSKTMTDPLPYKFGSVVGVINNSGLERNTSADDLGGYHKGKYLAFGDFNRDGRTDYVGFSHRMINEAIRDSGEQYGHLLACEITDVLGIAYQQGSMRAPEFVSGDPIFERVLSSSQGDFSTTVTAGGSNVLSCAALHMQPFQSVGDVKVVDINADGMFDLVFTLKTGSSDTAKGFGNAYYALGVDDAGNFAPMVRVVTSQEAPVPSGYDVSDWEDGGNNTNLHVVDWDGDGDLDLVWGVKTEGKIYVRRWINDGTVIGESGTITGTGFETGRQVVLNETAHYARNQFVDLDGDGHADRVRSLDGEHRFYLGTDFTPADKVIEITNSADKRIVIDYGRLNTSKHYLRPGYTVTSSSRPEVLYFGTGPLCSEAGAGSGQCRVEIVTGNIITDYTTTFDAAAFYRQLANPFLELTDQDISLETNLRSTLGDMLYKQEVAPALEMSGPMSLVTLVTYSQPQARTMPGNPNIEATGTQSYYYSGGKIQGAGRGFLGFKQVVTNDNRSGLSTATYYRQDWPFQGQPRFSSVYTSQGATLRETSYHYGLRADEDRGAYTSGWKITAKQSGTRALGSVQVYAEQTEALEYDLVNDGAVQGGLLSRRLAESLDRDAYGNYHTRRETVYQGDSSTYVKQVETSVTYGSYEDLQFWGLPDSTSVTTSRPDAETPSRTRHTAYSYYDRGACSSTDLALNSDDLEGFLCMETTQGSDPELGFITRHYYDGFGNRLFTKASNLDGSLVRLSTQQGFDEHGRYPEISFGVFDGGLSNRATSADSLYLAEAGELGMSVHWTSRITSRDKFGNPLSTQTHLGDDQVRTASAVTTAFGQRVFETDDTGGYRKMTMARNNDLCPSGTVTSARSYSAGGAESGACIDMLGRNIREFVRGFDGEWLFVDKEYDSMSRLRHISEPYEQNAIETYWTTTSYDKLGRSVLVEHAFNQVDPATGADLGQRAETATQYSGYTRIITNPATQTKTETLNALGELVSTLDADDGLTTFSYEVFGNLETMTDPGTNVTRMTYDNLGRKRSMTDLDSGYWEYTYTPFGEVRCQTDGKSQTQVTRYDAVGRVIERIDRGASGGCSTDPSVNASNIKAHSFWQYDLADQGLGQPSDEYDTVTQFQRIYSYDGLGRGSQTETVIPGVGSSSSHFTKVTYDHYGRVFQSFDAGRKGNDFSRNGIKTLYNNHGYIQALVDAAYLNGEPVRHYYEVLATDARGNVTQANYGNGVLQIGAVFNARTGHIETQRTDNLLSGVMDTPLQLMDVRWDSVGNVIYRHDTGWGTRTDRARNLKESFTYDNQNRLRTYVVIGDGNISGTVTYDALGNIRSKSDVESGTLYSYGSTNTSAANDAGPHAVTAIGNRSFVYDNNGNLLQEKQGSTVKRSFSYFSFDMVDQITWSGGTTRFTYGPDRQRFKRVDSDNGQTTTTLYIGDTEKIYYSDSTVEWKRNIGGVALVTHRLNTNETQETGRTLRYLLKDHLGSINLITDVYGMPEEQLAFDPWGKRRDETVWSAQTDLGNWFKSQKPITSRGFTGHEMIDGADVVHMNGRIYDSHIARFLQSDPLIQDPTVSGSLNRYSYVWNNPLNTTDPSGYAGFKQDQEEQKQAETQTCRATTCYVRDANGNWVSGSFGSKMDLSGGPDAATKSAGDGGTLENSASSGAEVTTEVSRGQRSQPGTRVVTVTSEELDPQTGEVKYVSASSTVVLTGGVASELIRGQVVNLLRSIGTGLVSSAGVAGGIVVGMLVPGNIFEEDFGCHSSQLTCTVNGQLVDAQTGLPLEGGMVGSGDPNDPDGQDNKVNWKSSKQFGHTFTRHGQGAKNAKNLAGRAASTGETQGQWLNNQAAAEHISSLNLSGNATIRIPQGMGQVIRGPGMTESTTYARVIFNAKTGTIRTAYPIPAP